MFELHFRVHEDLNGPRRWVTFALVLVLPLASLHRANASKEGASPQPIDYIYSTNSSAFANHIPQALTKVAWKDGSSLIRTYLSGARTKSVKGESRLLLP